MGIDVDLANTIVAQGYSSNSNCTSLIIASDGSTTCDTTNDQAVVLDGSRTE